MKSMLHKGFNPSKCKTTLKLAVSRIKLMKNKKGIQLTQSKREVGQLLSSGQDQTARIRVEHVVREEKTIAAFDLIEIYCELIVARLPIIESQKICPVDLKEAVAGIIFAAPRCAEIPELKDISKHLTAKYGKEFVSAAVELRPDCGVNKTLIEKLSARAPDGLTKEKILTTIAKEQSIKWESSWSKETEPNSSFPNASNIEKGSKRHMEPDDFVVPPNFNPAPGKGTVSNFQATQYTEPRNGTASSSFDGAAASSDSMHRHPSDIYHSARSGRNISNVGPAKHSYSSVNSSGDEFDLVWPNQPANKVSGTMHEGRSSYNMVYKDATDAANAAARSAEEASRAARAAAELASHDSKVKCAYKDDERSNNGAFRDEALENNSLSSSPSPERNPRVKEYVLREANRQDKTFETGSEVGSKSYQRSYDQPTVDISCEHGNPAKQAEWEEKARPLKLSPKKDFHNEDFPSDTERNNAYALPSEDSNQTRTHSGSADLSNASSHLVGEREHTTVDNPFFQEPAETKSSSFRYQYGNVSEDHSALDFNMPVFDDVPQEDPYVALHEKDPLTEDWELREPYNHAVTAPLADLYNQKDNIFLHPEQKTYGFEPSDDQSLGTDQGRMQIEKEHMHTDTRVNVVFDDYGSDDDFSSSGPGGKDHEQRSPCRNLSSPEESPVLSSPEPERATRSWERPSSSYAKHLYQPELTESFKNSPLFSQLDKPLPISFDDSDDDDRDAAQSKGDKKDGSISAHHHSPKAEAESNAGALREESLKFTMANESPGLTDKQSDIESRTELNVESWPRARKSGGLLQPPYTKNPSNVSSIPAYSRQSLEVTPKGNQWEATALSSEWEEVSNRRDSTHQETAGSDPDYNCDGYIEAGIRKSSSRYQGAAVNSEGPGSHDEDTTTLSSKGARVGAGVSRRTRASRESNPYSQPDPRPSYTAQPVLNDSVSKREPSSARAMERAQLLRWAEEQAGHSPTHQPQNSDEEEILGPSVEKQEMRSRDVGLDVRQTGNRRPSWDFPRRMEAEHNPSDEQNLKAGEENLEPLVEKKLPQGKHRSTRSRRPNSELPRRVEALADDLPTHKSKTLSLQEENLRPPLVKEKQQPDSTGESLPSVSHTTENAAASLDSPMKRAGHVHPRLPDFDTLADRIRALNRDHVK